MEVESGAIDGRRLESESDTTGGTGFIPEPEPDAIITGGPLAPPLEYNTMLMLLEPDWDEVIAGFIPEPAWTATGGAIPIPDPAWNEDGANPELDLELDTTEKALVVFPEPAVIAVAKSSSRIFIT